VVRVGPGASLNAYRFGTKTADFMRCGRCGGLIAALCTISDRLLSVLNAALFDGLRDRDAAVADFDSEGLEARLERRARSWTPTFVEAVPADEVSPVHRGDLFWVEANSGGSVPAIAHPHVVLQDDVFNQTRLDSVIVCALTSNLKRANEAGNVLLDSGEGELSKRSVVVVSQVSTVAKSALRERIGALSAERVEQVLAGMRFQQASEH